jgi:hypothetical protein
MKALISSCILCIGCLLADKSMIESPDRITPEWEEKVLGIKYGVTTLDKAVDEMIQGFISEIFDGAFIQKVAETIKQQPTGEGEFVDYWGNGTLKAKLPFKDGKAHGHLHGWHEDGNDAFKGFFCEGLKQGVHMTFYKPEEKKGIYKARLLIYNNEGKLDGDQRKNHKNGRLGLSVEYENGILVGALEAWNIEGKQYLSVAYKKGVKQKNPPPPNGKRKIVERPDERYVSEVINEFAKAATKEFGVEVCSSGASMPYDVQSIIVNFAMKKQTTIEEARELIVRLTERFVEITNKHEKLRPYLREYPFSPYRADIYLRFHDKMGRLYEEGSVDGVTINNHKQVSYSTVSKKTSKEDNSSEVTFKEPYEKAVEIVRAKERERAALEKLKKQ